MARRLLIVVLFSCAALVTIALAIGPYFLVDRFTTDDASPIADPLTTSGGQSVDVVQTDGTLDIADGALVVVKQSSPVDGDLGLRFNSSATNHLGKATFFKVLYTELANGIAGDDNSATALGFTNDAAVNITGGAGDQGLTTTATTFLMNMNQDALGYQICPTVPTTTDTMLIAVVSGGMNISGGFAAAVPWYAGQAATNYDDAHAIFIKKGSGPWLFQGISLINEQSNRYPVIASYNASFNVYDWIVLGDTDSVYNPYLKPHHYQSATGTDGVQPWDDTPEVGAAYDSLNGDMVIASNAFTANGSAPGGPGYITTATMSDSNVFGYYLTNLQDDNAEGCGMIFRRKAATGAYIGINAITNGNLFRIDSFNGSTFTARASVALPVQAGSDYIYTVAGAVIDSTCYAWWIPSSGNVLSLSYTSALHTQYGQGGVRHGFRIGTANQTGVKFIRWYESGRDGEFAGLSNFFSNTRKLISVF